MLHRKYLLYETGCTARTELVPAAKAGLEGKPRLLSVDLQKSATRDNIFDQARHLGKSHPYYAIRPHEAIEEGGQGVDGRGGEEELRDV